jgi:hypothetical protein
MLCRGYRGGQSGSPAGRPFLNPGGTDAQLSPRIRPAGAICRRCDQEACLPLGPPPRTTIGTPLDLIDCRAVGMSAPSTRSRDCGYRRRANVTAVTGSRVPRRQRVGHARRGGERDNRRGAPRFSLSLSGSVSPTENEDRATRLTFPLRSLQALLYRGGKTEIAANGGGSGRVGRAPGPLCLLKAGTCRPP